MARKTNPRDFKPSLELAGSARTLPPGTNTGATPASEVMEVTVRVRRRTSIRAFAERVMRGKAKPVTPENFDKKFGASEADLRLVESFAQAHNLSVVSRSVPERSVVLRGTVQQFSDAFGVHLANMQTPGGAVYRGRSGSIRIPAELEGVVEGVFGLDNRPQARPMFRLAKMAGLAVHPRAASNISYYPNQVAKKYKYPAGTDGTGQCIALIELGGGFRNADMDKYFAEMGFKTPSILAVSVDGAHNSPSNPNSADGEVVLDIQVAGGVAPGAKIAVYFAPNSDKGFVDAISAALHDTANKPSVISISWGSPEANWTGQAIEDMNNTFLSAVALGVTVTAAAGDDGSADGLDDGAAHVDFPASSPYVLACGGTSLGKSRETVWNDGSQGGATGGGISALFPVPAYQKSVKLPASVNGAAQKGRGVPDVAANADPATGYNVLVDGQAGVIGGTSAVAPLMAGLIARVNQKKKKPVGFIHTELYQAKRTYFKDITKGNNITASAGGYQAGPGWDACTGLGVPLGTLAGVL